LVSGTAHEVVQALSQLREQGYQAASIAKQLSAQLRSTLLNQQAGLPPLNAASLLGRLLQTASAHEPDSYLELTLLEPVLSRQPAQPTAAVEIVEEPATPAPKSAPATVKPAPTKAKPAIKKGSGSVLESWPGILNTLKQQHNTLYSIVRMAEPVQESDRLVLKFVFPFHQKRLKEAKNQQLLQDIIVELTGKNMQLDCVVDKKAQPPAVESVAEPAQTDPAMDTISNIFGSAELLD